jgi:ATP-dependent Lhr-like helicase
MLLSRYGVVARELAVMDPVMPPWRVMYEVLTRLELAGDVRRGYFVEDLSGAQFALPDACQKLTESQSPSKANSAIVMLNTQDPANLFGSAAPLDMPLLEGGTKSLSRRPTNWIVIRAGRPVLILEQAAKRITSMPSASDDSIADATKLLPLALDRNPRQKLHINDWNGQSSTTSPARDWLESAGFVRDYRGMTLYAAWR